MEKYSRTGGIIVKIDLTPLEAIPQVLNQLELIYNKLDANIDKRWFTTRELAKYTGYKVETIKSKVKKKCLIKDTHYFKRDGILLFDKHEIDKWVMGIQPDMIEVENACSKIVDEVLSSL